MKCIYVQYIPHKIALSNAFSGNGQVLATILTKQGLATNWGEIKYPQCYINYKICMSEISFDPTNAGKGSKVLWCFVELTYKDYHYIS